MNKLNLKSYAIGIKTTTATKFRKFLKLTNRCYNRKQNLRRIHYIIECEGANFSGTRTTVDSYRRLLERAGILERIEPGVYKVLQELPLTTQLPDIEQMIKDNEPQSF